MPAPDGATRRRRHGRGVVAPQRGDTEGELAAQHLRLEGISRRQQDVVRRRVEPDLDAAAACEARRAAGTGAGRIVGHVDRQAGVGRHRRLGGIGAQQPEADTAFVGERALAAGDQGDDRRCQKDRRPGALATTRHRWLLRGGSRPSSTGIRRNKYHRLRPTAGAGRFVRLRASLMFAGRIATAGDRAPVYVIALGTIRQRPAWGHLRRRAACRRSCWQGSANSPS